jgi:2-dehydro-3-deoxygalactonokinase
MRFVALDWGTTRCRALLVDGETVEDSAASDDGVSRLRPGEHDGVFTRLCGGWLAAEPDLPVIVAGMAGSREGWREAPYAACPAGPGDIAAALTRIPLPRGGDALLVPGLRYEGPDGVDVMRGEETHLLGTGVEDGLVCLPGTHCKWARMDGGRIHAFSTFLTGEMHALLREHSMIGRPATSPPDDGGFALGLAAARSEEASRGGLLNLLFRARAATLLGRVSAAQLGPYLSGLLTASEVSGALALFRPVGSVTVVAEDARAALYTRALGDFGIETRILPPSHTFPAGLARILAASREKRL